MQGENNHQFGLKGAKNSSWISDERISYYGYKLIRKLDHPFKNSDGSLKTFVIDSYTFEPKYNNIKVKFIEW